MRYQDAVKLHSGDEITVKSTGIIKRVMEVDIREKVVWVVTTDNCHYIHRKVR